MSATAISSIHAGVAALRAEHPMLAGRGWDFDGFRVWVESNAPALIAELDAYFADFRPLAATSYEEAVASLGVLTRISAIELAEAPDLIGERELTIGEYKPTVKGPKEAWLDLPDGRIVVKLRTGMRFAFGIDDHLAIGPCLKNPNQVVNFVNNRMIQWSLHRGALLGHASAIGHRFAGDDALPRAIAIAGFAGMGKSTLALHLMNDRRIDFLSNDRVMLHAQPARLEGIPKHPRINPGTILHNPDLAEVMSEDERSRFAALTPDELWQLEHKFDGLIRQCFPRQKFLLQGEFAGMVLLNWSREGSQTHARRISIGERTELLPALIKEPGVFHRPGPGDRDRGVDSYVELLADIPVLELSGTVDFDYGRDAALELLGLPPR
ncbi:HprK-related kinase B [Nannocystaceae bacterium ST9]